MMPKWGGKCHALFGVIAAAELLAAGCSRRPTATDRPAPPSGLPPLEGGQAGERPVHESAESAPALPPGHPQLPANHPPIEGAQAESALPGEPPPANAPVDPSKVISGVIQLSPKVKSEVHPGDVLFLTIRKNDGGLPGQILAVDRMQPRDFPIPFAIDGSKAMVAG